MRMHLAVLFSVLLCMGLAVQARAQGTSTGNPMSAEVKALYTNMGCGVCHGEDGRTPRRDTTPIIAGQNSRYTYLVLKAYKTGERTGVGAGMHGDVSDLLNDEQMKLLADYVAAMK